MMELAQKTDYEEVIQNWQTGFGDSVEEVQGFFATFSHILRTFLWKEDGHILGQLCLLPVDIVLPMEGKTKTIKAEYIYAVTTKASCKKQGICTRLLQEVTGLLLAEGKAGILVPADESLAHFYEKRGFTQVLADRTIAVKHMIPQENVTSGLQSFHPISIEEYLRLRENAFLKVPHVKLPAQMAEYAIAGKIKEGSKLGKIVVNDTEYGVLYHLGEKDSDLILLQETTGVTNEVIEKLACLLLQEYGRKEARVKCSYATYGIGLPPHKAEKGFFTLVLD